MTITITKSKFALAVVAVAMLIPGAAMAFHVFDDVPDGKFFAEPVEWAFDNGITTGKTSTTFAPDDSVTRGEAVTFLKRYHEAFGPVAHATVLADGSVVATRSFGITGANVSLDATSAFCFQDLEFEFTTVQVSPIYEGNEDITTTEVGYPDTIDMGDCDDLDAELEIATLIDGVWAPRGFTVTFFS